MNTKYISGFLPVGIILLLVSLSCRTVMEPLEQMMAEQTQRLGLIIPTNPPGLGGPLTGGPPTNETTQGINPTPYPTPPGGVYGTKFSEYPDIHVTLPEAFVGGYNLPIDMGTVQGTEAFTLTPQQVAMLGTNGFVVAVPSPSEYKEFYQIYESTRYLADQPVFTTTDAVFHTFHLIFNKMLRDLEQEFFMQNLEALTQSMLQASQYQYQTLKGTALEEQARRNLAYFKVADQLLGLSDPVPPEVTDLVNAELAAISAGASAVSPIWQRPDLPDDKQLIEDYSQYSPRGHYIGSEKLQRYFKALIWYGRLTFRLRDKFETQRALLLVQAMRGATAPNGVPAIQLWERLYDPMVFIVGKADDLSYREYAKLSDFVFGEGAGSTAFADEALLDQFIETTKQLPPPQVNSMWVWVWEDKGESTPGFRFMGQRYTLDAYIFSQLMWKKVGSVGHERDLPKGLDIFAAFGSEEAMNILKEMGENGYENYEIQMSKVRSEVSNLQQDTWTQNIYWSWLYAFQPLIAPKGKQYPVFMQDQVWMRKDLNTALSSWTELKHDTILHAKQVMAEMGGGEPEEIPRGYVEPNPEAYARLLVLAQMTYNGLDSRGLLDANTRGNLENLIDLLNFLKTTSEKELSGQPLTDDDYWRIQLFGGELEALTLAAADKNPPEARFLEDQKTALITDVATGIASVLEEAIGQPTRIYVILPDQPYRVAVGAIYSYYEFSVPPVNRMTDEQWQLMVDGGGTPPVPTWTSLFMAP